MKLPRQSEAKHHMNTLRTLFAVTTKLLLLSALFAAVGLYPSSGQTMANGVVTYWGGNGYILSIEVPPRQATLQIKGWDVFDGPCIDGAPGFPDIDAVGHLYYQISSPPCFAYGPAGELEVC